MSSLSHNVLCTRTCICVSAYMGVCARAKMQGTQKDNVDHSTCICTHARTHARTHTHTHTHTLRQKQRFANIQNHVYTRMRECIAHKQMQDLESRVISAIEKLEAHVPARPS